MICMAKMLLYTYTTDNYEKVIYNIVFINGFIIDAN